MGSLFQRVGKRLCPCKYRSLTDFRNRKLGNPYILLILGAIFLLFLVPKCVSAVGVSNKEVEYEVSGIITMTTSEYAFAERAFNFEVFVRGNRWLIKAEPFDYVTNRSGSVFASFQAGTDGNNIYTLSVFNMDYDVRSGQKKAIQKLKAVENKMAQSGGNASALEAIRNQIAVISKDLDSNIGTNRVPRNQAIGEIHRGSFPTYASSDPIAPLWLAYCSHTVIGEAGTNLAPGLFYEPRKEDQFVFVNALVTNSLNFPYLPESVAFNNRVVLVRSGGGGEANWETVDSSLPEELDATYAAIKFQRAGILSLPSEFQLIKFLNGNQEKDRFRNSRIFARVIHMNDRVGLSQFVPQEPAVIAVTDFRHSKESGFYGVRVFSKTNNWPSVEDVLNSKEYVSRTTTRRVADKPAKHRRLFVFIGLGLSTTAILILGRKTTTKTRQSERTKQ